MGKKQNTPPDLDIFSLNLLKISLANHCRTSLLEILHWLDVPVISNENKAKLYFICNSFNPPKVLIDNGSNLQAMFSRNDMQS